MKLLKDVKEEFFFATYHIDKLISAYLFKKLGIENTENMSNLGLKGRSKFESRVDLLLQMKTLSNDKKKKLEIFTEIYNVMMLKKENFSSKSEEYFAFLIQNYPQKENINSSERASSILKDFIADVQSMVKSITNVQGIQTKIRKDIPSTIGSA